MHAFNAKHIIMLHTGKQNMLHLHKSKLSKMVQIGLTIIAT